MPHFRKEAMIISLGISYHTSEIHEQINSSDSFFCRPPAVNSWIPSAIHCIHLFLTLSLNGLFRETSSGWRSEVNPPGITARFVFSLAITAFTLFCRVSLKRVTNKQASPPQATESRTPYFLNPILHLVCIHPAFLLCRNNDAVLVVDLRQSFSLKDHHGLKLSAVSSTRQHDRDPIFLFPVVWIFTVFLPMLFSLWNFP